jgi:apolipoprotein D and lipocalin family protein
MVRPLAAVLLCGCTTVRGPPVPTVPGVDLGRFMGDWFVIAHVPTRIERQAYNAVEH